MFPLQQVPQLNPCIPLCFEKKKTRSLDLVLYAFLLLQQQRDHSYSEINGPMWSTNKSSLVSLFSFPLQFRSLAL